MITDFHRADTFFPQVSFRKCVSALLHSVLYISQYFRISFFFFSFFFIILLLSIKPALKASDEFYGYFLTVWEFHELSINACSSSRKRNGMSFEI